MRHRPSSKVGAGLMRRVALAVSLIVLWTGCTTANRVGAKPETRPATVSLLTRADDLLREEQPLAARDLYAQIVAEPVRDAEHARALYSLARLYADPASGLRDYRAARLAFRRLLTEYPNGGWEADARAWNVVLGELAARDSEIGKREAEVARLRNETLKLSADLERLKRIDLNLDRRR